MIDAESEAASASRAVRVEADLRVVSLMRVLRTDADDAWASVTDPERIARWFLPVTGDLTVGGRYQLEGHAGGDVVECEPPTRFALTWESGGSTSWVSVTLSPDPDGTRLLLEHTVPADGHWEQFGPGAVGVGWDLGTLGLAALHGSSTATDPAEVAAWVGTEGGRELVRLAGQAWLRADLAAGTPSTEAERRAAATVEAYLGG